jgi:tetratricopeptide (TPR) repeat protein
MHIHRAFVLTVLMQLPNTSVFAEVIFKDKAGRTLTAEGLKNASGKVDWEIRSGPPVSEEARRLHQLGRIAGQKGDSKAALVHFDNAAKAAPDWPYPLYDAAYTYLLMRDSGKAYELYKRVDSMAPRGFFTAKTAVHSLRREANGELPAGTYLYFLSTEWTDDSRQKLQIADQILGKAPRFAPAWKLKATLETEDGKRLSYLDNGLDAGPDLETRGFLLINKALLLHKQGEKAEAVKLLGELALDPASPLDIEAIAKKTLFMIAAR